MSKPQQTGKIVMEYLRKFPTLSTRAIANKIWEDEDVKPMFNNYEHVRTRIKYYRGAAGEINRKKLSTAEFIRKELPEQLPPQFVDYTIPKGKKNILVLSDIHIPYQDNNALSLAMDYGVKHKVDTVILNGDIIDFYGLSRFEKDYRKRNPSDEINACKDFLELLRETFPTQDIIYKVGNHCERWDKHLTTHHLKGIEAIELRSVLNFTELGIKEVSSMSIIWAGKLAILHGHEHRYGMIAPVNPARGLFLRTKQSALIGHVHRTSEHTEKALDGKLIGTWSTGALCTLEPDYMRFNNHNHGFAHIELEPDGMFTVFNRKIINGRIL